MSPYSLKPLRLNEPTTQTYLDAKLRSYELCLDNECYDDAYINAHLIFMYWLYTKLWALSKQDSKLLLQIFSLHSFDSKFDRNKFLGATSALELHQLKMEERKYAEVFGAFCLDRDSVKTLKELVDERNKILHPSGVIVFESAESLEEILARQQAIAVEIANSMASVYVRLLDSSPYGKITYRKILKWESDLNLEQELVTRYHLSEIDISAIRRSLYNTSRSRSVA